ncbi:DUF134 domain-containing protein [Polaribacter sp. Hel1_85]|uniref:DUF134 domain-containing protein n=1 Tax=Polaribacter sp. Hel1_85 TaxID=1250005 RepID=UPI00052B5C28|nr:DUF134 domain-containing protein [Polaribacter sp. Hel1_85]KGL63601.1 hypothetical protein PHEL85_0638 [Polaribacter sp. Hel1_85]
MPRPKKKRKINNPPKMLGFEPFGIKIDKKEHINLQYEEYESIKLVIYDSLSQIEAAEKMEVSRPTLTRIYNSALKKIGQSFVEGKAILIKGGDFEFDKDWYKCNTCFKLIDGKQDPKVCGECPAYNMDELEILK